MRRGPRHFAAMAILPTTLSPDIAARVDARRAAGGFDDADAVIRAALALLDAQDDAATAWLVGGGECGALIRAHDWAATPLGPPEVLPEVRRHCAARSPTW